MVGSGRSFDEPGFLAKLKEIKGYILSDITAFPDVPFWIVESETVMAWWREHSLGTTAKISRQNALKLLQAIPK
jgi:hypothetical protein